MNITPAEYNITIQQGAAFALELVWKDEDGIPRDLHDWSAELMVRKKINDANPFISLSSEASQPTLTGIVLGDDGTIKINISENIVNVLRIYSGLYDFILTDSYGEKTVIFKGSVTVKKRVTRP